jgi:Fic family protein
LNVPSVELLRRIRAEYLEMPGLHLTAQQAQRLFGLEAETCDAVLATLLDAKFLIRTHSGLFAMVAT